MTQTQAVRPVAPGERILGLDVFRGFAMFGVLIAYCLWSLGTVPDDQWSPLNKTLGEIAGFVIDGKFYTILAFLFGLGFSLQLGRASDSAAAVRTYCRRLAVLAGIGLLHALLLRNGDILFPYAMTGFLLIPFRRASDRLLVVAALVALLVPFAAVWLWKASGVPIPDRPQLENAPYLVENAMWVRYWYETAIFTWPTNLTLFLFGFLAGRRRLIPMLANRPKPLAGIMLVGALAGAALFYLSQQLVGSTVSPTLVFTLHCWCLSSAYAAALLVALETRRGVQALWPLAAVGRMALTNYLTQAAIIVPLCLAFGWFDTFTPTRSFLLAFALFALQSPFSVWWLRHYRFGPAEWLWRVLTYGRLPAMKVEPGDYARL